MKIYLDYASSAPVHQEIKKEIDLITSNYFGNPSALHFHGSQCKEILEQARQRVSSFFNKDIEDVIFTSGATEANNLLVHGIYADVFLVDSISHSSLLLPIKKYNHELIPVNSDGILNEEFIRDFLARNKNKKICIAITPVNHMTGVIQNIDLSFVRDMPNVIVHADCAQAVHTISNYENYDSITISGHKIGAPIGIGALIANKKVREFSLESIFHGGRMEWGYRPGTTNYIFAFALSKSLDLNHIFPSHEVFERTVIEMGGIILGNNTKRSGNISCAIMPNVNNLIQTHEFAENNISVSTGSACSDKEYIFNAMNCEEYANNAIRVSSGHMSTLNDIEKLSDVWKKIYNRHASESFFSNNIFK